MDEIRPATPGLIAAVLAERWGGLIVTPEPVYRSGDVEGLVVRAPGGENLAVVTWAIEGESAEIVSLDALVAGAGHGRRALAAAGEELARRGVSDLHLITTNDNIRAIGFYLRAGWRLVRLHLDGMDRVRALKPLIPLVGEDAIPLRDMWEFEKRLAVEPRSWPQGQAPPNECD